MMTMLRTVALDRAANLVGELARAAPRPDRSAGSRCAPPLVCGQVDAQRLRARLQRRDALVEGEDGHCSPRAAAADAYCVASVDLPVPGGPSSSVLVPAIEAAAQQRVELGMPLDATLALEIVRVCSAATRRGKITSAAALDDEVVIAAAEVDAAQLRDPQAPALAAVQRGPAARASRPRARCSAAGRPPPSPVRSSSSSTVQPRPAKYCLSASIWRR